MILMHDSARPSPYPQPALSAVDKVLVAVTALLSVVNLIDLMFYGREFHNVLAAAGFLMMSFGYLRFQKSLARLGALLVLVGFAVKYLL